MIAAREIAEQRWVQKHAGHVAITRAIGRGDLPKAATKFCTDCGQRAAHWHHAWGYSPEMALCVIPLCKKCHGQRHGQERAEDNRRLKVARGQNEGAA